MKKKSNEQPLKEAIEHYLRAFRLEGRIKELDLVNSWEKLMGPTISRYTSQIYLKDGTLYVHLRSAALMHELTMGREKIIRMLNEEAGQPLVSDIVFR